MGVNSSSHLQYSVIQRGYDSSNFRQKLQNCVLTVKRAIMKFECQNEILKLRNKE